MAVVPTGEFTKEGKPKFKAAPTPTSIARKVSEKRVQTFGSGGRKISDTQRVKVTIDGEEKFVTPERALAISKETTVREEAKRKQAEIQRLTQEEIKKAGFDIEKITRRGESLREQVAKLIIAEKKAKGTAAEEIFKQRRIEEQAKLGKIERTKAVLVQFTTAAGRARVEVQVDEGQVEVEEKRRIAEAEVQPQFITTTERVISPEELRRQEDERRIIGNGIDVGVGTGNIFISPEKEQIQKLETLTERIKRAEEAREKLGLGEIIEKIQQFSRRITGGQPSFISGVVAALPSIPFFIAETVARVPETVLKVAALGAGLTIPETRELTKEESKRAFETAKTTIKQTVTDPESLATVLTISLIGALGKTIAKNKPQVFKGTTKEGVKTTILKFKGKGKGRVTSFK